MVDSHTQECCGIPHTLNEGLLLKTRLLCLVYSITEVAHVYNNSVILLGNGLSDALEK